MHIAPFCDNPRIVLFREQITHRADAQAPLHISCLQATMSDFSCNEAHMFTENADKMSKSGKLEKE